MKNLLFFFWFGQIFNHQLIAEDCGEREIRFKNYSVKETFQGSPVDLNLESVKKKDLRFFLGLNPRKIRKPNFAGHFRIIKGGCGNMCTRYVAIDLNDGEPYDLGITASLGINFKLNSSLVIVNPEEEVKKWYSDASAPNDIDGTTYYNWVDSKLRQICMRKFQKSRNQK